jgi:single-stranded-DNA-specific exonuclease
MASFNEAFFLRERMQETLKWSSVVVKSEAVARVALKNDLPSAIAQILVSRGMEQADEIAMFLTPRLARLSDPFLLPGMADAVSRIWRANDQNEHVLIYGDYDVDGVCSTALLTRMLRRLGMKVDAFIPERIGDGYGLTIQALNRALQNYPASLVITVDCGTNSIDAVEHARNLGIDVIVTDHHEPTSPHAQPLACLNPKLGVDPYLATLCGAGVAFKLLHGILKQGRNEGRKEADQVDLREGLDLVALATVADMVPLKHENRLLVHAGLKQMKRTSWIGLSSLIEIVCNGTSITSSLCGFQLGPRINAAGRMDSPMKAFELLMTNDLAVSRKQASVLDQLNRDRRELEKRVYEEALVQIEKKQDDAQRQGIVVSSSSWHLGVMGIVAAKVSRKYNRPTILLVEDADGMCKGSGRGIKGFDLLEALQLCDSQLEAYGGHRMAAGLSLPVCRRDAFVCDFNQACAAQLKDLELVEELIIDAWLENENLDALFYQTLTQLAPFGEGFKEPTFAISGARIQGIPVVMGGSHLRFKLDWKGQSLAAVAFNFALADMPAGCLDVAFTFEENVWNGQSNLQLNIRAMKPAL